MTKTRIYGRVRIGAVYECIFGDFKRDPDRGDPPAEGMALPLTTVDATEALTDDYNYRVPHEMIKKRAVVVIGRNRGQCIVVPISSKQTTANKQHKYPEALGIHIRLSEADTPPGGKYMEVKPRWAKADLVSCVDESRLRDIYCFHRRRHIDAHIVSPDTLQNIRFGVMKAIGMGSFIPAEAPDEGH